MADKRKKKQVKRTVKQIATLVHPEDQEILDELMKRVLNARNYMYSRLAGINSYLFLYENYRIRNEWVKNPVLVAQFKLPARFWKMVLSEVIGSLKSKWSNTINRIKEAIKENDNLTDDEKFYLRYVCSVPSLFGKLLVREPITRPKKIGKLIIREQYVHKLLLRYMRRYKGRIPYGKSKTFQVDADMYSYVEKDGRTYIQLSTYKKNNRVVLQCKGNRVYRKNIKVLFDGEKYLLHHTIKSKAATIDSKNERTAIDKGYKTMIVSSSGNHYGAGLNHLLSEETERLNKINQKRNPIYAQVRTLQKKGDFMKAQRIRENNLGHEKYKKQKQKHEARVKSYVNFSLNRFFEQEEPPILIVENLAFVSWNDKMPKHIKRKLSRWIKGYIDERLQFKCELKGIQYEYVNPAYTSQECHSCGCLGTRKTQELFVCPGCGPMNADENAAKTIRNRYSDKEITLYTPFKQVKEILKKREELKSATE